MQFNPLHPPSPGESPVLRPPVLSEAPVLRPVNPSEAPILRPPAQVFAADQLLPPQAPTGQALPAAPLNYQVFSAQQGKKLATPVYTTYGTPEKFTVKGRILEAEASEPRPGDSKLRNLKRSFHQFESDEKKYLWVDVSVMGQTQRVQSDKEGFFELQLKAPGPVRDGYHPVEARLVPGQQHYVADVAHGQVVIQNATRASTGIISDIDDTIQESHVTHKLKMAKTMLLGNPYSQKPVAGMAEFLRALDQHNDGQLDGDVTYVSGSPLNIAERLEKFRQLHQFPAGAMELKQLGLGANSDSPTEQLQYKLGKIRTLFNTYPNRSFVLVGDSGEKDPEVYRQIAQEFPGRVQAVYIHNVTGSSPQDPRFAGMLLFQSAAEAAADAAARGLISATDSERVRAASR